MLPVEADDFFILCKDSVLDLFFFATCNPGDGCLIPAPYFPAFDNDMSIRVSSCYCSHFQEFLSIFMHFLIFLLFCDKGMCFCIAVAE